jgi:hypothetical protein
VVAGVATFALCATAVAGTFDPRPGDVTIGTAGGNKYVKDPAHFDPSNVGFASDDTYCGKKPHVTGGGVHLEGPPASRYMAVSRPIPFGDSNDLFDNGWDGSGFGTGTGKLTVFGICRHGHLRYRHIDVPDAPSGNRFAKLGCGGGGYHVVGGGAFIATTNSWINSSYPYDGSDRDKRPDDGWAEKAMDTVGGLGGMTLDAICMRGHVHYETKRVSGVQPGSSASPAALCGKTDHVLGGGVQVRGPADQARAVSSYPIDRGDHGHVPDDGWQSAAYDLSGSAKPVTSYAICKG